MTEATETAHLEPTALAEQFDDLAQQEQAASMGMWLFLATEVMLFGAVFLAYFVYRRTYYEAFLDGSHHLYVSAGTINTVVLLTSSLFVALAVHAAKRGNNRGVGFLLLLTIVLGCCFLGIKAFEYFMEYREGIIPWFHWTYAEGDPRQLGHVKLFMVFYFAMTLLHALHMTIGMGVLAVVAWMAHRRKFDVTYSNPVEMSGLYWHFVDVVWVFLFPTLYLVGPHHLPGH